MKKDKTRRPHRAIGQDAADIHDVSSEASAQNVLLFPAPASPPLSPERMQRALDDLVQGQSMLAALLTSPSVVADRSASREQVAELEGEVAELHDSLARLGQQRDEDVATTNARREEMRRALLDLAGRVELLEHPNPDVSAAAHGAVAGDATALEELGELLQLQTTWWQRHRDWVVPVGVAALTAIVVMIGLAAHRAQQRLLAQQQRDLEQRTRALENEYLALHAAYVEQHRLLAAEQARPLSQHHWTDRSVTSHHDQRHVTVHRHVRNVDRRTTKQYDQRTFIDRPDNRTVIQNPVDVVKLGRELARHVPATADASAIARHVADGVRAQLSLSKTVDAKSIAQEIVALRQATALTPESADAIAAAVARNVVGPRVTIDVAALARELQRHSRQIRPQERVPVRVAVKIKPSPAIDAALADLKRPS